MTTAYWCVLIAVLLPYVWTSVAKITSNFQLNDNHEPRAFLAAQQGLPGRANAAQLNAFENLPAFAAAIIIAHLAGNAGQGIIDNLAMAFIGARVVHGIAYVTDVHLLRSAAWMTGFGIVVSLFILSA